MFGISFSVFVWLIVKIYLYSSSDTEGQIRNLKVNMAYFKVLKKTSEMQLSGVLKKS